MLEVNVLTIFKMYFHFTNLEIYLYFCIVNTNFQLLILYQNSIEISHIFTTMINYRNFIIII